MRWLDTALNGVFACCGGGHVRLLPAALRPIRPAIPIRNRHISSARQGAGGWYICDNRKGWRACFPAGIPQCIWRRRNAPAWNRHYPCRLPSWFKVRGYAAL